MRIIQLFFILSTSLVSIAQIGGSSAFAFALIENNARNTSLGGVSIANTDRDPAAGFQNPALINRQMHHNASLSYANHVADINYGFGSYGREIDSIHAMSFNIGFYDYGNFVRTDNAGDIIGEFDATDYTFQVGLSRKITDKITIGANGKFLYSVYEAYVSTAGGIDLGGQYSDVDKLMNI